MHEIEGAFGLQAQVAFFLLIKNDSFIVLDVLMP